MTIGLQKIPRAEKRDITSKIITNLESRAAKGPAEPGLDAYIAECKVVADALGVHVDGNLAANAERTARLVLLEAADDDVDAWYRHIYTYLDVEALRKTSPNKDAAAALRETAFPDGLEHIDDAIADENRLCRAALLTLRDPAYADTLKAIELPVDWLDRWDTALTTSDTLLADVEKARLDKRAHIGAGQDAENEWVELMLRLRRYVASRAKRSEKEKVAEGKELLAPLLNCLAKLRAEAKARATRKGKGTTKKGEVPQVAAG